ncbi:MAG: dihydropteroate synthase [Robiginitomaculum sp.]|nr:dihydropteroate synthase [Robiginitomaculum sp.]
MAARANMNFRSSDRPLVCGIVNVTPDSFSDGGRYVDPDLAIKHALTLIGQGADIVDIGGESTRPGSLPVCKAEELSRVLPVITAIRQQSEVPISIDTMKPQVAEQAIAIGADIWNDVSALRHDTTSLNVAAELGCPMVLMHMQGEPKTMQNAPAYKDVFCEVLDFLQSRIDAALQAGVAKKNILVDPGIGFGKTLQDNLELLANLDKLQQQTDFPVMLGASRKRMIGELDFSAPTDDRLGGSLALVAAAYYQEIAMVRVHDVRETVQMLRVLKAVDSQGKTDE